ARQSLSVSKPGPEITSEMGWQTLHVLTAGWDAYPASKRRSSRLFSFGSWRLIMRVRTTMSASAAYPRSGQAESRPCAKSGYDPCDDTTRRRGGQAANIGEVIGETVSSWMKSRDQFGPSILHSASLPNSRRPMNRRFAAA